MKSLVSSILITNSIIVCLFIIGILVSSALFIGFITTDEGNHWAVEMAGNNINWQQVNIDNHMQQSEILLDQHIHRSNERLNDYIHLAIQHFENSLQTD